MVFRHRTIKHNVPNLIKQTHLAATYPHPAYSVIKKSTVNKYGHGCIKGRTIKCGQIQGIGGGCEKSKQGGLGTKNELENVSI